MSVGPSFREHLEGQFHSFLNSPLQIIDLLPVPGGDINQTFLVKTSAGHFFLKLNESMPGTDFFERETEGLLALAATGALKVPQPLFYGRKHGQYYLVLEYLESGAKNRSFW